MSGGVACFQGEDTGRLKGAMGQMGGECGLTVVCFGHGALYRACVEGSWKGGMTASCEEGGCAWGA
jgi:hypothetical protein